MSRSVPPLLADLDLNEMPPTQFEKKRDADAAHNLLLEELPGVPSAYQPSGRFTLASLLYLLLGAAAAAVVGPAVALIFDGLAIAGWSATGWLGREAGQAPLLVITLLLWAVLAVVWVFALLAYFLCYFMLVVSAQGVLGRANRMGKNRNVYLGMFFSLLSASGAVWLYWTAMDDWLGITRWYDSAASVYHDTMPLARWVLGGIAVVLAGGMMRDEVTNTKFCEECQQYMTHTEMPRLTLGGARAVLVCLAEDRLDLARAVFDLAPGNACTPELFTCSACGCGFIDYKFQFKANFSKGGDEEGSGEVDETWIFATLRLDAEEAAAFKEQGSRRVTGPVLDRLEAFLRRKKRPE